MTTIQDEERSVGAPAVSSPSSAPETPRPWLKSALIAANVLVAVAVVAAAATYGYIRYRYATDPDYRRRRLATTRRWLERRAHGN